MNDIATPILAGADNIGIIIFLVIAGVFSLINSLAEKAKKKRLQQAGQPTASAPQPAKRPAASPTAPESPWEQMRRFLEEQAAPTVAPQAPAPPVAPAPKPRRLVGNEPEKLAWDDLPSAVEARHLTLASNATVNALEASIASDIGSGQISALSKELEERDRIAGTDVVALVPSVSSRSRLTASLRGQSARDAIVLAEILGPPLSLRPNERSA